VKPTSALSRDVGLRLRRDQTVMEFQKQIFLLRTGPLQVLKSSGTEILDGLKTKWIVDLANGQTGKPEKRPTITTVALLSKWFTERKAGLSGRPV